MENSLVSGSLAMIQPARHHVSVSDASRPENKQPFAFDVANGKMRAFADLWDAWKDHANGQRLQSYTIITTDANELMLGWVDFHSMRWALD